ncbi:MAG TPA: helix-turn-helix domain-containing protein [Streptosporangiaceae bacterium]|nr:helix-turn-helix domain-containing protein [Streptosporangiaceae bacterium]
MQIRERRGRGRQAEARRNDDAVLEAARIVFATQGPDAPMSAVAAQAGVGMGSLYRRFAAKAEMLDFLCEASLRQQVEIAEAALALADPLGSLTSYVTGCVDLRVGVLTLLAGEVTPSAGTRALALEAHSLLERIVTRAQGAGALRADVGGVDIYRLVELFSRRSFADPAAHQRLVALALDGMRAPGRTALPGDEPTWADYARQWQGQPI